MSKQSDNTILPPTNQPQIPNLMEDQHSVQSDRNESIFEFQLLEEFIGPVDEDNILTKSEGAIIDKPTFYSAHSFRDIQDLVSQCCKSLEIGGRAFKRQLA